MAFHNCLFIYIKTLVQAQIILDQQMKFNPLQKQETVSHTTSKGKAIINTLLPLSIKQVNHLISHNCDFSTLGKIVVIGLVTKLKQMVGRTQVTVSDGSGFITIIEGQRGSELQQEQYFRFVVNVRTDKQELILYSQHFEKITDYNQIQYHIANIMMLTHKTESLQI